LNKKEWLYISNLLSLSRFVLLIAASLFLILFFKYHYIWSAGFIILIWLSDVLDGYFARKRNEITELGKIIDPIADKTTVIAIGLILLFKNILPLWFVLILLARDILIFSGGAYIKKRNGLILQSNWSGKLTVFIIGFTLLFTVILESFKTDFESFYIYHIEKLELFWNTMILLSIVMTVLSLSIYFSKFMRTIAVKD
jgi:cardiolipin synthase